MAMQLSGGMLTKIAETLQTIEESGIQVTTFKVDFEGDTPHEVMLRWDDSDPKKARIVGITSNSFGSHTRR